MKPATKNCVPWVLMALLWFAGTAMAGDESDRELLRQRRAQIEARFDASMRECAKQFQVTNCELAAKAQRRAALGPVLKREQALDLAQRRQQAQEQRERVAAKQLSRAEEVRARAPLAAASAASAPRLAPPASSDVARPRPIEGGKAQTERTEQAAREASRARAATQQRVQQAQQHEAEVLAREADLVAKGKRAAPLPVPGASVPGSPASAAKR